MAFQALCFNTTARARTRTFQGREYFVAPAVMMTNGVHKGNKGRVAYTKKFLKDNTPGWRDFNPLTVYHPKRGGKHVSAQDLNILDSCGVGFHRNTRFGKTEKGNYGWKTECWFDKEQTKRVDPRVYDALKNGDKTEVSTGMFLQAKKAKGSYKGEQFDRLATRMVESDHLAVLPDQEGACSTRKGAGLFANTLKLRGFRTRDRRSGPVTNEMSFSDISNEIRQALAAKNQVPGYSWNGHVVEVFDGYCVYCVYGGAPDYKYTYYRQEYTVKGDKVALTGEPTEVERKVNYEPVTNSLGGPKMAEKAKKKVSRTRIVNLLVNGGGFDEKDRGWLSQMSTKALLALREVPVKKLKAVTANSGPDDDDDDDDDEEVEVRNSKKPRRRRRVVVNAKGDDDDDDDGGGGGTKKVTLKDLLANAGKKEVRELFTQALGVSPDQLRESKISHQRERARMIREIVANEANDFTEEELAEKSTKDLRRLAKLASSAVRNSGGGGEDEWGAYLGADVADPTVNSGEEEDRLLDGPDLFANGEDRDYQMDEEGRRRPEKKAKAKSKVRS